MPAAAPFVLSGDSVEGREGQPNQKIPKLQSVGYDMHSIEPGKGKGMDRKRWGWKYWCNLLAIGVGSFAGSHVGAIYGHSAWGATTGVFVFSALTTLIFEREPMMRASMLWMLAVASLLMAGITSHYYWLLFTVMFVIIGANLWRRAQKAEA